MEGAAAAENGIEGEGYVVVTAAAEGEGGPAAGGDRGDLAAPAEDAAPAGSEDAPAPAVTVTAAEDVAAVAPAKAPAKVSPVPLPPSLAARAVRAVVIRH
jgi:hypothetical protein